MLKRGRWQPVDGLDYGDDDNDDDDDGNYNGRFLPVAPSEEHVTAVVLPPPQPLPPAAAVVVPPTAAPAYEMLPAYGAKDGTAYYGLVAIMILVYGHVKEGTPYPILFDTDGDM